MAETDKTVTRGRKAAGAPPEEAHFSVRELQAVNAAMRGAGAAADGGTVLRLLPVSPWRAFAFWSATAEDWTAARRQLPAEAAAIPVLRFFDFTPLSPASRRPHPPFDVEIQADSTGWYVDVWKDGKTYVAELGLLGGDRFVALARSNPVELPPAGPSPELGFEWRTVSLPDSGDIVPAAPPRPVPELFRPVFPRRPVEAEFPLVPPERIGLTAAEASLLPSVEATEPLPEMADDATPVPAADQPEEPVVAAPEEPVVAATADTTVAADAFPLAACDEQGADAAGQAEAQAVAVLGDPAALALAPLPAPRTAPETAAAAQPAAPPPPAPLPLESVAALSSFSLGPDAELELNAELHIYGRTRPGATLSLFGRPVAVAADGTFSVRRPLPNGALVLPILLTGGGDGGGK